MQKQRQFIIVGTVVCACVVLSLCALETRATRKRTHGRSHQAGTQAASAKCGMSLECTRPETPCCAIHSGTDNNHRGRRLFFRRTFTTLPASLVLAMMLSAAVSGYGSSTMHSTFLDAVSRTGKAVEIPEGVATIVVDIEKQRLYAQYPNGKRKTYPISSSAYGTGNQKGSLQTPLGLHKVKEKFGDGLPIGAELVGRRYTQRIVPLITRKIDVPEDIITTRILWLDGQEPGKNKGGNVDSHSRFIYIHGTAEEGLIGQPASHGCIRMKNKDVIELFDATPSGSLVYIRESRTGN